jgi:hypothetical protein
MPSLGRGPPRRLRKKGKNTVGVKEEISAEDAARAEGRRVYELLEMQAIAHVVIPQELVTDAPPDKEARRAALQRRKPKSRQGRPSSKHGRPATSSSLPTMDSIQGRYGMALGSTAPKKGPRKPKKKDIANLSDIYGLPTVAQAGSQNTAADAKIRAKEVHQIEKHLKMELAVNHRHEARDGKLMKRGMRATKNVMPEFILYILRPIVKYYARSRVAPAFKDWKGRLEGWRELELQNRAAELIQGLWRRRRERFLAARIKQHHEDQREAIADEKERAAFALEQERLLQEQLAEQRRQETWARECTPGALLLQKCFRGVLARAEVLQLLKEQFVYLLRGMGNGRLYQLMEKKAEPSGTEGSPEKKRSLMTEQERTVVQSSMTILYEMDEQSAGKTVDAKRPEKEEEVGSHVIQKKRLMGDSNSSRNIKSFLKERPKLFRAYAQLQKRRKEKLGVLTEEQQKKWSTKEEEERAQRQKKAEERWSVQKKEIDAERAKEALAKKERQEREEVKTRLRREGIVAKAKADAEEKAMLNDQAHMMAEEQRGLLYPWNERKERSAEQWLKDRAEAQQRRQEDASRQKRGNKSAWALKKEARERERAAKRKKQRDRLAKQREEDKLRRAEEAKIEAAKWKAEAVRRQKQLEEDAIIEAKTTGGRLYDKLEAIGIDLAVCAITGEEYHEAGEEGEDGGGGDESVAPAAGEGPRQRALVRRRWQMTGGDTSGDESRAANRSARGNVGVGAKNAADAASVDAAAEEVEYEPKAHALLRRSWQIPPEYDPKGHALVRRSWQIPPEYEPKAHAMLRRAWQLSREAEEVKEDSDEEDEEDEDEEEEDGDLGDVGVEGARPTRRTFFAGSDGMPLASRHGDEDEDDEDEDDEDDEDEDEDEMEEVEVEGARVVRRTFYAGSDGKPIAGLEDMIGSAIADALEEVEYEPKAHALLRRSWQIPPEYDPKGHALVRRSWQIPPEYEPKALAMLRRAWQLSKELDQSSQMEQQQLAARAQNTGEEFMFAVEVEGAADESSAPPVREVSASALPAVRDPLEDEATRKAADEQIRQEAYKQGKKEAEKKAKKEATRRAKEEKKEKARLKKEKVQEATERKDAEERVRKEAYGRGMEEAYLKARVETEQRIQEMEMKIEKEAAARMAAEEAMEARLNEAEEMAKKEAEEKTVTAPAVESASFAVEDGGGGDESAAPPVDEEELAATIIQSKARQSKAVEEKLRKQILKIFDGMDFDKDGSITHAEQEEFYKRSGVDVSDPKTKAQMDATWAKVDVNGDGSISLEEFERLELPMMKKAWAKKQAAKKQAAKEKAATAAVPAAAVKEVQAKKEEKQEQEGAATLLQSKARQRGAQKEVEEMLKAQKAQQVAEEAQKEAEAKTEQVQKEAQQAQKEARQESDNAKVEVGETKKAVEQAMKEMEERVRKEAYEQGRREAEAEAAKKAAEADKEVQVSMEAEKKAKQDAEELAKKEAEERATKEAEEKVRKEEEELARKDTEELAMKEAYERGRKEAEEKARKETDERIKELELKLNKEAAMKAAKQVEAHQQNISALKQAAGDEKGEEGGASLAALDIESDDDEIPDMLSLVSLAPEMADCVSCFDTFEVDVLTKCANGHEICRECVAHLASPKCTECGVALRAGATDGSVEAGAAVEAPVGDEWEVCDDGEGNKYWHNTQTGESVWHQPEAKRRGLLKLKTRLAMGSVKSAADSGSSDVADEEGEERPHLAPPSRVPSEQDVQDVWETVVVDWEIKVYDEDEDKWEKGIATHYLTSTGPSTPMVKAIVGQDSVAGKLRLDEYTRLMACNSQEEADKRRFAEAEAEAQSFDI